MNTTRRTGILLALATAAISGFSVFVNASGVTTFDSATVYTTAKNVVAALVLLAVVGLVARTGARLTRPAGARQWVALAAIGRHRRQRRRSCCSSRGWPGRPPRRRRSSTRRSCSGWPCSPCPCCGSGSSGVTGWRSASSSSARSGWPAGCRRRSGRSGLMILAATLLWAVEVVVAKWLLGGVSSWTVAVARMGLGSVALLAWLAVRGQLGGLASMTGEQLGWVLVTGLLLAGYVGHLVRRPGPRAGRRRHGRARARGSGHGRAQRRGQRDGVGPAGRLARARRRGRCRGRVAAADAVRGPTRARPASRRRGSRPCRRP